MLLIQKANLIVNKVVLNKDDMRFSRAEYISAILKSLNIKIITVSDSKVKIRMEQIMQLNKNVIISIVIGVVSLIVLQILIANITTPKVEIVENVELISDPPKEHYKIDNLTDGTII